MVNRSLCAYVRSAQTVLDAGSPPGGHDKRVKTRSWGGARVPFGGFARQERVRYGTDTGAVVIGAVNLMEEGDHAAVNLFISPIRYQ